MRWFSQKDLVFEKGFQEAEKYSKEHGAADAPFAYVTQNGYKLGVFLSKCREKYAKGKLSQAEIDRLNAINMVWFKGRDNDWDECYEGLKAFYNEHGHINLPADYKCGKIWLAKWLNEQKHIILGNRKGKSLSQEQIEKLNALGFSLESSRWMESYELVRKYIEKSGTVRIPCSEKKIYNWVASQKLRHKKADLSQNQEHLLRQIGVL